MIELETDPLLLVEQLTQIETVAELDAALTAAAVVQGELEMDAEHGGDHEERRDKGKKRAVELDEDEHEEPHPEIGRAHV